MRIKKAGVTRFLFLVTSAAIAIAAATVVTTTAAAATATVVSAAAAAATVKSAAAAAAAGPSSAFFTRLGLVYLDGTAIKLSTAQVVNRILGFVIIVHFDEGKSSGTTCFTVEDYFS